MSIHPLPGNTIGIFGSCHRVLFLSKKEKRNHFFYGFKVLALDVYLSIYLHNMPISAFSLTSHIDIPRPSKKNEPIMRLLKVKDTFFQQNTNNNSTIRCPRKNLKHFFSLKYKKPIHIQAPYLTHEPYYQVLLIAIIIHYHAAKICKNI